MDLFTEEEWNEFAELVDSLGPLYVGGEEIVFRGSQNIIDRSYAMSPVKDARTISNILSANPDLLVDAGFHTILPVAKSVEMHMRLLYFGTNLSDFNKPMIVYLAIKSIRDWMKGEVNGKPHHFGKKDCQVYAGGEYFERFASNIGSMRREWRNFTDLALKIYECGNKYRHNQVRDWKAVKNIFEKQNNLFNEFCELFDKLTG